MFQREAVGRRSATQLEGHPEAVDSAPAWSRSELEEPRHVVLHPNLNYIIRWLCLNFVWCSFHLFTLSLSSTSSITAVKHSIWQGSFVQAELGDGMTSSALDNAQILITHAGRLILMSFSCDLRTSYFEIPLSLYPEPRADLWAWFFLLCQLEKFF